MSRPAPAILRLAERREQRLLVDDRPARGVDQDAVGFISARSFAVTRPRVRSLSTRWIDEEVRLAEQVLLRHQLRAAGLGFLLGQVLAPGDQLHADRLADLADLEPSLPKPSTPSVLPSSSMPSVDCHSTPCFMRAFS